MSRFLLAEDFRQKVSVLEKTEDGLPTRIRAIVQQADRANRNRRVYPKNVLLREINKFNIDPQRRPGLIDHPAEAWSSVQDIGILWEKIWMDDQSGEVWGEGALVETRKGNDFRAAIKAGVEVGISSRGYASATRQRVDGQDVWVIGDDFELQTFDAVVDPGVAEARIKHSEQLELTMDKETNLTEAEIAQAEEQAAAVEAVENVEVVPEETEAAVPVEETEAAGEPVVEEAAEEPEETTETEATVPEPVTEVSDEVATLTETLAAVEARNVQLEARIAEAEVDAETLRKHASNLLTAMEALKQIAHDALDRDSFYSASDFASVAAFCDYMSRSLNYQADFSDEEVEALESVVTGFGALFAAFEQAKLSAALVEKVKDDRLGLLLFRRVLPKAEKVGDLDALIEAEREAVENAVANRRAAVAPRGDPTVTAEAMDPNKAEALRLLGEMARSRKS